MRRDEPFYRWVVTFCVLAAGPSAYGQTGGGRVPERAQSMAAAPTAGQVQQESSIPESGAAETPDPDSLLGLDIEQLAQQPVVVPAFNVEVTSVAREPTRVGSAAAAIYVITEEDVRRSGARNIPDLLRMVPGMQVAQINSSKWAVSARGFNGEFGDKLLVLIDGRSIYTPFFSGVFWEQVDVLLEDIERIEVIRGPGATLWGSNAVNGVINIITKHTKDTQGQLLYGGSGSEELGFGAFRDGGRLGKSTYYRVYAKYFNRDDAYITPGVDDTSEWDMFRGGFRIDSEPSKRNTFTLQGDVFDGDLGQTDSSVLLVPPFTASRNDVLSAKGGNLVARWTHIRSDDDRITTQFYYSRYDRKATEFQEQLDTFDLEIQRNVQAAKRHDLVMGMGYRFHRSQTAPLPGGGFQVVPADRDIELVNAFLQDNITIVPEKLNVSIGSKVEYNDFTHWELQPGIRGALTPNNRNTVWASVSRAVRIPNRVNDDSRIDIFAFDPDGPGRAPPVLGRILGDPRFVAEDLLALELGYRTAPRDNLSLDFATFFNVYDNLATVEPGTPFFEATPGPPHLVSPMFFANEMDGETYGLEFGGNWNVTERWKLRAAYSWLQMQLHGTSPTNEEAEGESPHNQFHIRSYADLPCNLEFDTALYYVDNLPALAIPSYWRLDMRMAWRPVDGLEFVLGLQNLLDDSHPEFSGTQTPASLIQRSIYGMIRCNY